MRSTKGWISRALSLLLAGSMCLTGLPGVLAAPAGAQGGGAPTGSIGVTLRFDLPQTAENAAGRDIQLKVSKGDLQTTVSLPDGTDSSNGLSAGISAKVENVDGEALTTEERVGYYQAELTGLTAGKYTVELTGRGYKPFRTEVTLDGYSKHLILGTGDGTFPLGNVAGEDEIDDEDLNAMSKKLGGGDLTFDLNGDGKVDVTDLSYIKYNQDNPGSAQVLDTAAIVSAALEDKDLAVTGSAADLFRDDGEVQLAPKSGSGEIVIPITLTNAVDMSQIQILCPDSNGAVQKGEVEIELESGSTDTIPFDATPPEGVHAIGRTVGQRVVTIDLGRKVAVKKVTITVTATAGGTGHATVRKVEFLKEIVPDSPKNDQAQILSAVPGEGSVALEWTSVNNVTGYKVEYWLAGDGAQKQSVAANKTSAVISGLENLKTYQFQVTAVNGEWSGTPSAVVSATPEPGSVPGAPSNIGVVSADQALRLSWGKTKDAVFYQVFYRKAGDSAFQRFGGDLSETSAVITGLTNGVTYQVAVKAGNSKGVGPYSATASGTPKKEELILPELPADDRIDNSMVESVVMTNPNNVNSTLCPNFTTADVLDSDAATYWIAKNWSLDSHFTYTFREPQDMNYAILVPYLGGNYKYALNSYKVTAWDDQGEVLLPETLYFASRMDSEKNYLVLTFPMVKGVKKLSIALNEREGAGRVSISEMAFYESDGLAEDIAALFTDGSFTALAGDVTADRISALSQRLEEKADFYLDLARLRDELVLAQGLLDGQAGALGLVKEDFQSRSGGQDRSYGQSASALQPLGVSARAGATVAVYAQLPGDQPVSLVPTQFYGESGIWSGAAVQLVNGRNYITIPRIGSLDAERGGPLYLTYAGDRPEEIKIQVRGDDDTFLVPVLELSGWYDMDEAARKDAIRTYVTGLETYMGALSSTDLQLDIRNTTEISTPSVLLSIPADRALAGLKGVDRDTEAMVEAMYQNVLAWEDVLYVANQVQGIIPAGGARPDSYRYPMATRQNIRYMRMFAGAFMYAAGNHVGIGYGSTSGMVCGRPVSATGIGNANALFGWGIAHEIGHNMDKLGKAAITNNIYSLAIQAWDGGAMERPTRLTNSDIWSKIYDKTSVGRPGAAGNVFVQLGMYWQLHLAYDNANEPLSFYNAFFTAWKSGEHSAYTSDERIALIASETAGKDLTDFFTRWGLALGDAAKAEMAKLPKETRALWYLNDDSYAHRLENGAAFGGSVSVTASVTKNEAALTITGGDETILGYEIRRNGEPVAFTTESTFTDDLGPANNLTYTYSVVPIDKLGNIGSEAWANEVRVAWDTTIDSQLYDVARDGDTVTITMESGAVPVTGIKITGTALTGTYTAEIKAKAGDAEWVKVKEGALSGDETVGSFPKPGADPATDARIWTYDTAVLKIGGVPAGASVTPLDYPGDRVDLYPEATVGKLQSDYRYGDGADEVIPAGTLVVLGTYRGDPAYNTIEVEVRYNKADDGAEAGGTTFVERSMNGYSLLLAELPEDKKVSDTSDGFWIFVPDVEAEKKLNQEDGIPPYIEMDKETGVQGEKDYFHPMEIRAVCRRFDEVDHAGTSRLTSSTLWISFPELETLPEIAFQGEGIQ